MNQPPLVPIPELEDWIRERAGDLLPQPPDPAGLEGMVRALPDPAHTGRPWRP